MAEINVVPYIDVMLVLLVIFMITAPLLTTGVEVDLPNSNAKGVQAESAEPILLSVRVMRAMVALQAAGADKVQLMSDTAQ